MVNQLINAESVLSGYRRLFGGAEPTALVRAPGRVNLIGEHVDYNDGLVLPIAIDRGVFAVAGPSGSDDIQVYSTAFDETVTIALRRDGPSDGHDAGEWSAYPRGVAAELAAAGVTLAGTRIFADSDLPVGAGLSSSAALEVAVALGLLSVAGEHLPPSDIAHICRLAEHHYAGVPCGIMDQFVCTGAVANAAMLLDCREEAARHIPWPDDDVVVLVIDSRCRHKLSDGMYGERVRQCARAAEAVRSVEPAVQTLRDVTAEQLDACRSSMEPVVYRRARHVVTEIQRTCEAAAALERGDFTAFGKAINGSHDSLRDDYEVSSAELDDLVETARGVPGVFGARMTGAGFGGCVVVAATRDAVPRVEAAVRTCYNMKYGVTAHVMTTRACEGATTTEVPRP